MADLKLDFTSMDGSENQQQDAGPEESQGAEMYPNMTESASDFDASNFDHASWSPEDHASLAAAVEFLKLIDPTGEKFGRQWAREAGDAGGNRLGDSRLHVLALARASKRADALIADYFGAKQDGEGARLSFNMPGLSSSQREALKREIEGIVHSELMSADAQYIGRAKRSLSK